MKSDFGKRIVLVGAMPVEGRMTHDVVFQYRMNAGFLGDVNRMHPASIEPCQICVPTPPTAYGQAVVIDAATQGVRPLVAGDSALTAIYGITVRPYPTQQQTGGMAAPFGPFAPPLKGAIDVLRSGYIMVGIAGATKKGGAVFVWIAVSSAGHVQSGFEGVTGGVSTISLTGNNNSTYNGVPDASAQGGTGINVVELAFNV